MRLIEVMGSENVRDMWEHDRETAWNSIHLRLVAGYRDGKKKNARKDAEFCILYIFFVQFRSVTGTHVYILIPITCVIYSQRESILFSSTDRSSIARFFEPKRSVMTDVNIHTRVYIQPTSVNWCVHRRVFPSSGFCAPLRLYILAIHKRARSREEDDWQTFLAPRRSLSATKEPNYNVIHFTPPWRDDVPPRKKNRTNNRVSSEIPRTNAKLPVPLRDPKLKSTLPQNTYKLVELFPSQTPPRPSSPASRRPPRVHLRTMIISSASEARQ